MSETAKYRHLFLPYCQGNGLDIGFGGDPIIDTAICFDLPERYSHVGEKPQHIKGDARDLSMFRDDCLDYVYSSHCIEDFGYTEGVLAEWSRVLKHEGYLCLLFPDQQVYEQRSNTLNSEHKHKNFGLQFVLNVIYKMNLDEYTYRYKLKVILKKELFDNNDYNCALILQKV